MPGSRTLLGYFEEMRTEAAEQVAHLAGVAKLGVACDGVGPVVHRRLHDGDAPGRRL